LEQARYEAIVDRIFTAVPSAAVQRRIDPRSSCDVILLLAVFTVYPGLHPQWMSLPAEHKKELDLLLSRWILGVREKIGNSPWHRMMVERVVEWVQDTEEEKD
jgi:hypothetical protein